MFGARRAGANRSHSGAIPALALKLPPPLSTLYAAPDAHGQREMAYAILQYPPRAWAPTLARQGLSAGAEGEGKERARQCSVPIAGTSTRES